LGDANRTVEKSELEEKMYNLGSRLEEMKAKLRDITKENKKLREIDKF
jgi:regulator of replication initiation timing